MVDSGAYNDLLSLSSSFSHLLNDIHQIEREHTVDFHPDEFITTSISTGLDDECKTSTTVETKQEGTVKWHVYAEYLRAGAGMIFGVLLIIIMSSAREATYVFSNWWLAAWNDDENYRYYALKNCTTNLKNSTIGYMTDDEWINYRNRLFYIYSGRCSNSKFML